MKTTVDFLDELKARNGGASDYAIAKILGVTRSAVSNYRNGKSHFDDLTAARVAKLLEIDPALVVMAVHAERAKKPEERALWEGILERLGGLAAALALGIGLQAMPIPSHAAVSTALHNLPTDYGLYAIRGFALAWPWSAFGTLLVALLASR